MPSAIDRLRANAGSQAGTPIPPMPKLPVLPDAMAKLPGVKQWYSGMQKWQADLEEWRKKLNVVLGTTSV